MEVAFDHFSHPSQLHDLAQPVAAVVQTQTPLGKPVIVMRAVGGLTKLEAGAIEIAAAVAATQVTLQTTASDIAGMAADLAELVLSECAERQQESERQVVAQREAQENATRRNGHDDVGEGRILTP